MFQLESFRKSRGEESFSKTRQKRLYFCTRMLAQQLPASIIVAISMGLSDMADSLVLGSRIGEIGLATIALSAPVYMIMNVIIQGFGPGGSIRYATLMAEGKEKEAVSIYRSCIQFSILAGLIITLLVNLGMPFVLMIQGTTVDNAELYYTASRYLRIISAGAPFIITSFVVNDFMRNEDMEKIAGIGAFVGNVLDIALNIMLVLVIHMGIAGSAIATVTGKTVSLIIYFAAILMKRSRLKDLVGKPVLRSIPICFHTGASTAIQYFSDIFFFLAVNNILMRLAGQTGIAVFDLIQNISYLLMFLCLSFAEAGQPAVSTYTGEKNSEVRRFLKKRMLRLGEITIIVLSAICFIFAKNICHIFGMTDPNAVSLGVHAIRTYLIGAPAMCGSLILGSYYQACNHTRAAYLISLLRGIIILIPSVFAMSPLGIRHFFWFYPLTEYASIIIFSFCSLWKRYDDIQFDESRIYRYLIENDAAQLQVCLEKLEEFCDKWEIPPKKKYLVQLTLEELIGAIMKYGFEDSEGLCEVTMVVNGEDSFVLHVRDDARTFNPFDMTRKNHEIVENEVDLLCIDMIRGKASSFLYRRYNGFNALVVQL